MQGLEASVSSKGIMNMKLARRYQLSDSTILFIRDKTRYLSSIVMKDCNEAQSFRGYSSLKTHLRHWLASGKRS